VSFDRNTAAGSSTQTRGMLSRLVRTAIPASGAAVPAILDQGVLKPHGCGRFAIVSMNGILIPLPML
jgi:hypothetical protein